MKMVHIPTMDKQVREFAANPTIKVPKGMECFLFAVYFAAVVSLSPEDTLVLAKAHFLVTDELIVVQAFAMYLVVLRRFEDARVLWSLCGLLGR